MEQMALVTGIVAMASGAAMFGIGMFGWRPVAEKAGGWLETPAAMAGALGWLVRFALRSGGATRPRLTAGRALDVTPQCAVPARGIEAASPVASPSSPTVSRSRATAGKRTGSRKRTGKRARSGVKGRASRSGSRSGG